ncbi:MAG: ribonuclease Y [Myxococcota bacterium]
MNSSLIIIVIAVVGMLLGFVAANIFLRFRSAKKLSDTELASRRLLEDAQKEAERLIKEAQANSARMTKEAQRDFESETRERRQEIARMENRLLHREENLEKKNERLEERETELKKREKKLQSREEKIKELENTHKYLVEQAREKLEKVAAMTSEEARQHLIEAMESEAREEAAKLVREIEEKARQEAEEKAKDILAASIQRFAGEYTAEQTVTVVSLPNDEMKGRIIGREGRNIRSLEAATGVDLIIDDTPEAVIISSFNPIRREVAKLTLERLVADGRIHPGRIEELVEKSWHEVEQSVKAAGEQATFDLGIHGMHPELIKLIGRLKYLSSASHNAYKHSMEVAFLCGLLAGEIGFNVKQARRAGILHDIGKAVEPEVEGSHAEIAANLAKRHKESPLIVNAIAAHHGEVEPQSVLAVILQAANNLSNARPGARKEVLESYVKRLEDVEIAATTFPGVQKAYAIQAGRELRIIVDNAQISDSEAVMLSRDIAKKIETDFVYPGQIKVTVIREVRKTAMAK